MLDYGIAIDDIMCDDITCEDLHLPNAPRMDDTTCGDRTYDDLIPECLRWLYWD